MAPQEDGCAMVNNDDEGGSSAPVGIPVEEAIIPSAAVAGETTASPSWKGKRSNDNTSADEATTTLDSKKPRLESDQKKDSKAAKAVDDWNDDMKWVCAECKEAECLIEPSADQFLLCDGHCHRIFHYPCAGLSQIPAEEEDFICKDCSQSRHQCAFCQDYGQDHVDVFACRKDNCGLFFHESCLALNNVPVKMMMTTTTMTMMEQQGIMERTTTRSPTSVEADPPQLLGSETLATTTTSVPVFVCPAHHCWTCTQDDALQKEREQQQQQQQQQQDAKRKEAAGKNGKNKKRGTKSKQTSIFQCKTEGRIYRCLYCPWAYHLTCLPPTSKFHELAILCPDHSLTQKLPDLDPANSLQSTVEDKIERTVQRIHGQTNIRRRLLNGIGGRGGGPSSNPFFPGLRGDRLVTAEQHYKNHVRQVAEEETTSSPIDDDDDDHHHDDDVNVNTKALVRFASMAGLPFCLPVDIKNEVHSKPPNYTHVHGLRYDPNDRPKKIPPTGEQCQCMEVCGEDCFNRMALVECCGEGPSSNCRLGAEKCGNRELGKRQLVKCKPKRESGKGWGLATLEDIPKGKLVQEYVGEVINEAAKEKRLVEWNKEHPNDPNFYVMGLGSGWYVDAREYANMSRFINHSCDPNCQVTTINVRGYKRNGIFAIRAIKEGEFLSYDYHFDTKQADRFLCRCGAKNCRGTMQGGGGSAEAKKPASWKEAKARYENGMRQLAELNEKQVTSQVGALIPAAEHPTEYVAAGPPEKYRDTVVRNGVFLWRNAVRGSDFGARHSCLERAVPPSG